MKRLLVIVLLLTAVPLAFGWPRAHRLHGAVLYSSNGCQHCHRMGAAGGRKGPDLSSVGRHMNRQRLLAQIREGGNGMPAFEGVMARAEIDDLVAFLHSCKNAEAPGRGR